MLRFGAGCAAAMLLAWATPARAEVSVDTARAAIEASEYLKARADLTALMGMGISGPNELAEIHRLYGIVAGALGETQVATVAFQLALALNPKMTLPVGTSPKIGRPFASAQGFFKTREPLKIKTETTVLPPTVTLVVQSDPMSMVARARVTFSVDGGAEQTREETGKNKTRITIALPEGARIDLRVVALDTMGNRVGEIGSADVPIVIVGGKSVVPDVTKDPKKVVIAPPPPAQRPTYLQWWVWGGATVVFAGTGSVLGLAALTAKNDLVELNATSPGHTFDEAKQLESKARTRVLLTNITYGAAAVCGVTAAILYFTRPRAGTERRTAIVPVPVGRGGAIVLKGRF
jgi:hypothetical protein